MMPHKTTTVIYFIFLVVLTGLTFKSIINYQEQRAAIYTKYEQSLHSKSMKAATLLDKLINQLKVATDQKAEAISLALTQTPQDLLAQQVLKWTKQHSTVSAHCNNQQALMSCQLEKQTKIDEVKLSFYDSDSHYSILPYGSALAFKDITLNGLALKDITIYCKQGNCEKFDHKDYIKRELATTSPSSPNINSSKTCAHRIPEQTIPNLHKYIGKTEWFHVPINNQLNDTGYWSPLITTLRA
ncbi:hypothetical protein LP316_13095 [Thalassotalea sp. LPB0316]|uniref:hypothetical protein n=1 Tax=Thalassotalea sp. LPB0316 TaxID=2769490 RepID=UPI001865AB00|nr:hypothetical protein [Thalassotalea sp. LPB0316]QOL25221.1 hypothetical protein LP316_13095 [Thalassotalea sp. LPB0316]